MKAKPVLFNIACSRKPYTLVAVDINEVLSTMVGMEWHEEYGIASSQTFYTDDIFLYIVDDYGYYRFLVEAVR